MDETLEAKNKNENECRKLYRFGKKILNEDDAVSFVHRICLQEEEEYLKIKAGGVDTCGEGHTNRLYVDDTARGASSSSSSSRKKVKAKTKFSYGDICERFRSSAKLPEPVVRAQTIYCSRTALTHYNAKHGTEYKLVEPLVSARVVANGVGFHCNFTATKLEKDNTPSDLKRFYGELECHRAKVKNIKCCIIDASTAWHKCCPGCPRDLCHCPCGRHDYAVLTIAVPPNVRIPIDSTGSEIALARYNREHGTEYEFVKVPRNGSWLEHPSVVRNHCHFIAKLESPTRPDVSWSLFFADYVVYTITKRYFLVPHCCILATEENLDALRPIQKLSYDRCSFCRGPFLHPPGYATPSLNVVKLMRRLHPTV